jgi:hypothetical protein
MSFSCLQNEWLGTSSGSKEQLKKGKRAQSVMERNKEKKKIRCTMQLVINLKWMSYKLKHLHLNEA